MLASRAVRWKFEFSVVRRRRPDAAGRHRAALGCGFEGWLEPVTAEAKVDCLPFRRNEGTTAVRKQRSFADDGKSVKSTAADRRGRQHEDGAMAYSDGEFPQDVSRKKATRQ